MRKLTCPAIVLVALSSNSFANDACRPIVAATIAELKAGATQWGEREQAVARAAAGAACVKTMSGNYAGSSLAAARDAEADDSAEPAKEGKDDDGWWPFNSARRNDVSASPGQKPYERKR